MALGIIVQRFAVVLELSQWAISCSELVFTTERWWVSNEFLFFSLQIMILTSHFFMVNYCQFFSTLFIINALFLQSYHRINWVYCILSDQWLVSQIFLTYLETLSSPEHPCFMLGKIWAGLQCCAGHTIYLVVDKNPKQCALYFRNTLPIPFDSLCFSECILNFFRLKKY